MIVDEQRFCDEELGMIFIVKRKRNRNIVLRIKNDGIMISIPAITSFEEGRKVLERYRTELQKKVEVQNERIVILDELCEFKTHSFKVSILRTDRSNIYSQLKGGILSISVPKHLSIGEQRLQELLRKHVEYFMRKEAKRLLPHRVMSLALKYGFEVMDVKISSSKGRWGSCSSQKVINLSLYLMLLPDHLIELVLIHELCHTIEMNHSNRFWSLLNQCMGGKAAEMTQELKNQKIW